MGVHTMQLGYRSLRKSGRAVKAFSLETAVEGPLFEPCFPAVSIIISTENGSRASEEGSRMRPGMIEQVSKKAGKKLPEGDKSN